MGIPIAIYFLPSRRMERISNKSSPKRIAIFASSYLPFIGGAQIAIDEIAKRNPGFHFFLYCAKLDKRIPQFEKINGVSVYRIGLGRMFDKFLLPIFGPLKALRTVGIDCTIWAMMAEYGGMAALAFHLLTFKRNKFLLTLQEGGEPKEMEQKAGLFLPFMKMVVRNATQLQVISNSLLEWAQRLGFRSKNRAVVPNGVDIKRFERKSDPKVLIDLKKKYGIQPQTKVLFSASRLKHKNGMLDAVKAMQFLPECYFFLIAGEGPQETELQQLIADLKLGKRVVLLGSKSIDEVVDYLQISYLFVRPSLSEGLGNAFLEAMAAGVPVVATLVGGIKDFLIPEETGMAAIPGNPESIAKCIQAYANQALYEKIKINGQKLVKDKFDWDLVAAKMKLLLE
jgi:glycosyltransferase involved in cell wall biosynthesis